MVFLLVEQLKAQYIQLNSNGNLTIAGNADFAGSLTAQTLTSQASAGAGLLTAINTSTNKAECQFISGVGLQIGFDIPADPNVEINRDGSATFAGQVSSTLSITAVGTFTAGGLNGVTASNYGLISFSNAPGPLDATDGRETYSSVYARNLYSTDSSSYVWKGVNAEAEITSWIRSNGSCSFDGTVEFADRKVYIDQGGGVYLGTPPLDEPPYTNRAISLNNDGSATFTNDVDVGKPSFDGSNSGIMLSINEATSSAGVLAFNQATDS